MKTRFPTHFCGARRPCSRVCAAWSRQTGYKPHTALRVCGQRFGRPCRRSRTMNASWKRQNQSAIRVHGSSGCCCARIWVLTRRRSCAKRRMCACWHSMKWAVPFCGRPKRRASHARQCGPDAAGRSLLCAGAPLCSALRPVCHAAGTFFGTSCTDLSKASGTGIDHENGHPRKVGMSVFMQHQSGQRRSS